MVRGFQAHGPGLLPRLHRFPSRPLPPGPLLSFTWPSICFSVIFLVVQKNPPRPTRTPRPARTRPARCHPLLCGLRVENYRPATVRDGGKKGKNPPRLPRAHPYLSTSSKILLYFIVPHLHKIRHLQFYGLLNTIFTQLTFKFVVGMVSLFFFLFFLLKMKIKLIVQGL